MQRREFIRLLSCGLAAGWLFKPWPARAFPVTGEVAAVGLTIACLADAHLRDGNDRRPEAASLARAVTEIRALNPEPHLVLLAGDLAHDGNPMALGLGQEILSGLPLPMLAVRGEGDGPPAPGGAGWKLFNGGRFFHTSKGVNLLGLDTVWQDGPGGPGFALGEPQRRWLAGLLARVDPAAPLIVLSHAPLSPLYRPWGQWTLDSGPLLSYLARFENVLFIHGHVHHSDPSGENPHFSLTANIFLRKPQTENRKPSHLALPATSWPLPSPLTGTPRQLVPGLGPRGCGWALFHQGGQHPQFRQVIWQA